MQIQWGLEVEIVFLKLAQGQFGHLNSMKENQNKNIQR